MKPTVLSWRAEIAATVDTAFQPSYTRAASFWLVILLCMLEGITMPRRRIRLLVTLALGLIVAPLATEAQQPGQVYKIGLLLYGSPPPDPSGRPLEAFRQGLRDLGYIEG
jgi:hypothetical protein